MKLAIIATILAGAGCTTELSLHDGAGQSFAGEHTCPLGRLTIRARPDLPPHVVLPPRVDPPPAEIAADPERLQMWNQQQAASHPDLDRFASTFEVSGCRTTELFVCGHPRSDIKDGDWSADIDADGHVGLASSNHVDLPNMTTVDSGVVTSSVVCLPASR